MPGPFIHLGVGLVALLLYFDDRHRTYALLLLPFAVLPDLDHYAPFYAPRLYFHNFFILIPSLAVVLYGWATKRRMMFDVGLMASFGVLSHLVLDFFAGSEALFYPLMVARYGFLGRPEVVYEVLTYEVLPKSVWPYSVEALGVILCAVAFTAILVVRRRVQPNQYVTRTA
ncbi:MAG: hypothetical protein ACXV5F_02630 [Halobacteriota archaeon]